LKLNDKIFEHNDLNHETNAQIDELIEMSKSLIKMSDSITTNILSRYSEKHQSGDEINEMQKQINYLKTELEEIRKKN
jgi:HAMP domain-containing protein